MIKLSISQAARKLGVSRFDIQNQINSGKLQTHEGYVTTDSLRLAYPNASLHFEQDAYLQKMQQIKNNAVAKVGNNVAVHSENEKKLTKLLDSLKTKLQQEEMKNQHYALVFAQLTERLAFLEAHCHADDKQHLHQLQQWIEQQH